MARKYNSGLGVLWYLPGKKRSIGTTTVATSDLIELLSEGGETISEVFDSINYDPEGKAILKKYIDAGYGNRSILTLMQ